MAPKKPIRGRTTKAKVSSVLVTLAKDPLNRKKRSKLANIKVSLPIDPPRWMALNVRKTVSLLEAALAAEDVPTMPLSGGQKIVLFFGNTERGFGTLGAVVNHKGLPLGITCAHVALGIPPDQPITTQRLKRRIAGTIDELIGPPIMSGMPDGVDAAIVEVANTFSSQTLFIDHIGPIRFAQTNDMKKVAKGSVVRKTGAKTGFQQGVVAEKGKTRTVEYTGPSGTVSKTYTGLIIVENAGFADQGDSGSLVVQTINGMSVAIGMLIAVDLIQHEALIQPMPDVLDALDLR